MSKNTSTPNPSPVEDCPSCPICGGTSGFWPADYVDNGVGMQKCGPAHCDKCGWSEPSFDQLFNTPAQTAIGDGFGSVSCAAFLRPSKEVWRWYAWTRMRRTEPFRWIGTCWCAPTEEEALPKRDRALMEDCTLLLVRELTTYEANAEVTNPDEPAK